MNRLQSTLAFLLTIVAANGAAAQYQLDLAFDGEGDRTGPATGHERVFNAEPAPSGLNARLVGEAHRTDLDGGRYGRGIDFPGGRGTLDVMGWTPRSRFVAYAYVRARSTTEGLLVSQAGSFSMGFADGEIVARATPSTGGPEAERAFGVQWPDDGAFHHVSLRIERTPDTSRFLVSIDFADETAADFEFAPATSSAPLQFGGFDGVLDELNMAARDVVTMSLEMDRFNRMAGECIEGLVCDEEVLTSSPPELDHDVPIRLKTIYDPTLCGPDSPCPLVIDVSGGGSCPNDYTDSDTIRELAALGFVVATVDPYCETGRFSMWVLVDELPLLIAAKNYVLESSGVRDLLADSSYMASGCSHGAGAVAAWAMTAEDHPMRTFARSTSMAGVCPQMAGLICGVDPSAIDPDRPAFRQRQENTDLVGQITPGIAASREIALSWGANLDGPVCEADGSVACSEEGKHGMTYGSRRFRSVWEDMQPAEATGYFVEDIGADCRHCAPPDSEAFRCGACMLRFGRDEMGTMCPACLTYEDESIDHGGAAELCPIDADWYDDPVAMIGTTAPDAGMMVDDGGVVSDGGGMVETPPGSGCQAAGASTSPLAGLSWLGATLIALWRRRQRR